MEYNLTIVNHPDKWGSDGEYILTNSKNYEEWKVKPYPYFWLLWNKDLW